MARPTRNPYILPGALATFVAGTAGESGSVPPPPTITTTWATFAGALGVSAPLSLRAAAQATRAVKGAKP